MSCRRGLSVEYKRSQAPLKDPVAFDTLLLLSPVETTSVLSVPCVSIAR